MGKHLEMMNRIKEFLQKRGEYEILPTTNLPIPCKNDTKLYHPDIVLRKEKSITHIIEPETSTGGTTIIGKIMLAEICISKMRDDGKQSPTVKPKLIFLYHPDFPESELNKIKFRCSHINKYLENIQEPIIQYFSQDFEWY